MTAKSEQLISSLGGWDGLELEGDRIKEIRDEQEKEGRSLASLFHQAFVQNDAGAIILKIMMKQYLAKTIPDGKVTKAGRQAGKADLVREILLNLDLAEGE